MKEFITGILIGYVSYLIFTAIYLAGQIIDMQMGFGIVNVMDPVSNIQVPITSNFYFVLCMVMFLSINGHHLIIKALYDSFSFIPLGKTVFDSALLTDMTRTLGNIFILGFKISAPIVASMLIIDMALGVIMKTIPQLNIFVVGMPLKILVGFLILFAVMPIFVLLVDMIINGVNSEMYNFIEHMVPK
jgi:flagellar biosynthetic protein FliR